MMYYGNAKGEIDLDIPERLFDSFRSALISIQRESNLSTSQIIELIDKEIFLPASVFSNRKLGVLEIIVKYLREERGLSLKQISVMLKRDNRTIWSSYNQAKKKQKTQLAISESDYLVPVSIFSNRGLGVLEVLVLYLKKRYKLKFSDIGRLISRDQRTVWTVHRRASLK